MWSRPSAKTGRPIRSSCRKTGGYFTARGSSDDKAMAASFVSVLSQLKREGFKPERDIILALTADEELGDVPQQRRLLAGQQQARS
jgi:acetylornithine deacetylase/succinyl-diaminopimelate desuccinylase-like protein